MSSKEIYISYGKPSPDKVITEVKSKDNNKKLKFIETANVLIVDISTLFSAADLNSDYLLDKIDTSKIDFLSESCFKEFKHTLMINMKNKKATIGKTDSIYTLLFPTVPMNTLHDWKDRIEIFYYNKGIYLNFYKIIKGSSGPTFKGLYWFDTEIRQKYNLPKPEKSKNDSCPY